VNDPVEPVAGLPPTPPPLPAAPRFCRACGLPWDPMLAYCPACASAGARPPPAISPLEVHDRSVPFALSLYFAWLTLSLGEVIWILLGGNTVTVDMASTALATVMVFGWCLSSGLVRRAVGAALRHVRPLWCLAGFAIAPFTFAIASAVVYAFNHTFKLHGVRYTDDLFAAGWGWGMSLLLVCVQPAVVEEVAFRGVIFSALRQVLESNEAVLVSALMFMIIHLSVPSFPHLLLIGLALGWLRVRTGSLVPGMCLHFTHNLLCIVSERWPMHHGIFT